MVDPEENKLELEEERTELLKLLKESAKSDKELKGVASRIELELEKKLKKFERKLALSLEKNIKLEGTWLDLRMS